MDLPTILTSEKKKTFKSLIISAHFDDETVGMGTRFPNLGELYFIHTTDSSPLDLEDAKRIGFTNAEDYYIERKKEFTDALRIAGISQFACYGTGIHDKEAVFNIKHLVEFIAEKIESIKPDVIFTHPYEGGHPDHDTTSFAVYKAVTQTGFYNTIEFTSYHSENGLLKTGSFLYSPNQITEILLSEEKQLLKTKMYDAFVTQKDFIKYFISDVEMFRPVPKYDYSKPPHEGKLFYDNFDWGVKSDEWRRIVSEYS